jgi:folate-binding protein YgfZ
MSQTDNMTTIQGDTNNPALLAKQILSEPCVCPLDSLGILRIHGNNSQKLLHGQVTNNIEQMTKGELKMAAACSPKGRIYATFYAIHQGEHFDLVLPRSTLEQTLNNLSKFAPLYRCKLEDVSEQYQVLGFNSEKPELTSLADLSQPNNTYPLEEENRSIMLVDKELLPETLSQLTSSFAQVTEAQWQLLSIRLARIMIEQSHSDQFIPQMLNYQATGAISFKKGCYTGQEIIARAQYRGGVKKRLQTLKTNTPVQGESGASASHLFVEGSDVGEVLLTAINDQSELECLAVLKDIALEQAVHLGSDKGPLLQHLPLPYDLEKRDI